MSDCYCGGVTLDQVVTKVEQEVLDMAIDPPDVISDHSIVSCRVPFHHQHQIVMKRECRRWSKLNKDEFQSALFNSDLCDIDRPDSVEEYFNMYHYVLQTSTSCTNDRWWLSCSLSPFASTGASLPEIKETMWQTCLYPGGEEQTPGLSPVAWKRALLEFSTRWTVRSAKETVAVYFYNYEVWSNKNTHQGMSNSAWIMDFVNENIASVRRSTGGCPVQSSL